MADVDVEAELSLDRSKWLQSLRAAQADLAEFKAMAGQMEIQIPIRLIDSVSPQVQQIIGRLDGEQIGLAVVAEDRVSAQVDAIREANEGAPIVLPVVAGGGVAMAGAGSAAAGAIATGSPTGAGAQAKGFFSGMLSRQGMMATFMAMHGLTALAREVGLGDNDDINRTTDPDEQLRKRRANIEQEHSASPRGAVNWFYGWLKLQPTYDEEMKTLDEAEAQSRRSKAQESRTKMIAANQTKLRESVEGTDVDAIPSELKRKDAEIDLALKRHLEAADKITEAWKMFGFKTYGEAVEQSERMKRNMRAVADEAHLQNHLREEEYRAQTEEIRLRAHGRPDEARLLNIREHERRDMLLGGGDPQRQRDVLGRESAELENFIHEQAEPHVFTSELAYSQWLQQMATTQGEYVEKVGADHKKHGFVNIGGRALGMAQQRLMQNRREAQSITDDDDTSPNGAGGGGAFSAATDGLAGAADKLDKAADKFNNAETVGVIKD